jgi:REP element-mobilizing transposase RayT
MVLAYHVIIAAYGFWLPNDQRGSWSDFVRRWELLRFGPATKTESRRSVAGQPFDWAKRAAAKASLMYPVVTFSGMQALAIASGFADGVRRSGYQIQACAILPDHAHLVIGRHSYQIEQVTNRLKGAATRELGVRGLHPLQGHMTKNGSTPSPWAEGLWKVFLDSSEDVERAIDYVELNPTKENKRQQKWPFVMPYDLWRHT